MIIVHMNTTYYVGLGKLTDYKYKTVGYSLHCRDIVVILYYNHSL